MPVKAADIERLKKERDASLEQHGHGLGIDHGNQSPEAQKEADEREQQRDKGDEWDRPPGYKEVASAVPTTPVGDGEKPDDEILTYEEVLNRTGERLGAKLVGFDPLIIVAIVSALIQLISGKLSSERSASAVQDCCKRRPFAARVRINLALSRQGVNAKVRNQVTDVVLDMGKEASFNEMVAFCNCCNQEPTD